MKSWGAALALVLSIAGGTAMEGRRPASFGERPVGEPSFGELQRALASDDSDERKVAVRSLARLGERRSWRLVLGALGDPHGEVADVAQLLLETIGDPAVLDDLLGRDGLRSKDENVRLRAAEGLGRATIAVPAEDLARGLADRSTEVRRRVLWSVERLAARDKLSGDVRKDLAPGIERRWRGDRDPAVRATALLALASIDATAALELADEGLGDRREEVRCAALMVAGQHADRASVLMRTLVHDPSPRVRSQLVDVEEAIGTRDAAKALVVVLEVEERLRLKWSVVDALRRLSGMKYRLDPRPWKLWADRLSLEWRPEPFREEPEVEGATRAFGGIPLLSDRVTFLFDLSGSLWRKRDDGTTRKELADVELRRALGALPEDAMFNVVPYTDRPFPFSERLVKATRKNVERAIAFFEACRENGQGNFFDAAVLALEDPEVDTVMALTDGAPTGGQVWSLELIVPLLVERNRFRKVRFDSVLVDAPRGLHRHWDELARRTGGRSRALEEE